MDINKALVETGYHHPVRRLVSAQTVGADKNDRQLFWFEYGDGSAGKPVDVLVKVTDLAGREVEYSYNAKTIL